MRRVNEVSFYENLWAKFQRIHMLDWFSLFVGAVKQKIRGLRFAKLKIWNSRYFSLSDISIVKAVPYCRILLEVSSIANVMTPLRLISYVNNESVEFVVLILYILVWQYFAEIDGKLEAEWLFYLLSSTRILEQSDCNN